MLESGLIGGLLVALVSGAVQVWLHRIKSRTAERLKGLDLSATRDGRALEAESHAFGYMQKALEDARKEADDLRGEYQAAMAARVRAHDAELGAIKLELAREQRARHDALEDAFNVRTLAQSAQTRHEIERAAMLAELNAAVFRSRIAALWIASAERAFAEGARELPPAPYWVSDDGEPPVDEP